MTPCCASSPAKASLVNWLPLRRAQDTLWSVLKTSDDFSHRNLIRFLHDLGIALNYQDHPILQDRNILNPEWVTGGVYKILNSNELYLKQRQALIDQKHN